MRLLKNVPHSTEIAFTFFADIANEENGGSLLNSAVSQRPRDRQKSRNSRTVVRDPRPIQLATFAGDTNVSSGRENRIEMRAQPDERSIGIQSRPHAKNISQCVLLYLQQAELFKFRTQPFSTRSLAPGRRRNRSHLQLQIF